MVHWIFFLSGCGLISAIVTVPAVQERRPRADLPGIGMAPAKAIRAENG
jgi:hypothetical protein